MPLTRRRSRTHRPLTLLALAAVGLAGCAAIPTSGPINSGEVPVSEPAPVIPIGNDPVPDAEPERLVMDFISASSAGFYDDFEIARKYLTTRTADVWDPRAQVLVYQGEEPTIVEGDDEHTFLVRVPVIATVDDGGRYTETVPGSLPTELVFEVREENGQWRISALADGVLMRAPNFYDVVFRRTALYFATPDRAHLVPDMRWFPSRNTASSAVSELLVGPSGWLRDAVVTGIPEGTRLSTATVPVTNAVATVDLSAEVRVAEPADVSLLRTQLETTLGRLPGTLVTSVETVVGGLAWDAGEAAELRRDVAPERGPFVLAGGRLAVVEGRDEVVPLEDAAPLTGIDANSPALSPDEQVRVVRDGTTRVLLLPLDASPPVELLSGDALLTPTVDRFGWVWSGEQASTGTLTAVDAAGTSVAVDAEWLDTRMVRSVRVSRDGARIAVVSTSAGGRGATIEVAGVVRDEDGVPQRLSTETVRVGSALEDVSEVAWSDEGMLAVLGTSGTLSTPTPTMHLVPIGGPTQVLPMVRDTVGIASSRGDRGLYLAVEGGVLYSRQGSSWVVAATGVRDPVFPG